MQYPGRIIKLGEADAAVVKAVKERLNTFLADDQLTPDNPNFGPTTKKAVQLFQAQHVDAHGNPLKADGEIGSLTWAALFGEDTVPHAATPVKGSLLAQVLKVAAGEEAKKVREVPKNSNRGPQVEAYLKRAGCPAGCPWCCAFVYWCFDEAANQCDCHNPMVQTAGCLDHWGRATAAGAKRINRMNATADPALVKPGMIFVLDFGEGKGHTGLIEQVSGGFITTIEGNTDASKTREGGGVYRLTRKIRDINRGFIDYSTAV